jgi:hypothetical protein
LWDVATGTELRQFKGHLGQGNLGGVTTVAFAPDGRTVASGGDDTTALVWAVSGSADAAPVRLRPEQLARLWDDLASKDAVRAYSAQWKMVAAAGQTVPFLRERLAPVKPAEAALVGRSLGDLDSPRFAVRERARARLEGLGESAAPALRAALSGRLSAEVRRQVEGLLGRLEYLPERLRLSRAVGVLEQTGTAEARQLLERLADGIGEALLTREAKAALHRLGRRSK